jgi:hypothetical protein
MKVKELELEIALLKEEITKQAKEIAELKNRQPVIINFPQNYPCLLQHYPSYPYAYPQQLPPIGPYNPYWFNVPTGGTWVGDAPLNLSC